MRDIITQNLSRKSGDGEMKCDTMVCGMRYAVCGMRYAGSIAHCHNSCTVAQYLRWANLTSSDLNSNYLYYHYPNSSSNYRSGSPVENLTADLFAHCVNQPSLLLLQARLIALALTFTAKTALKTSNIIKLLDQNCRQIEKIKIAAVVVLAFQLRKGLIMQS